MMKLTMVTVCFNAEACIEKTIKSVLMQVEPIYEYIIVDGASTDNTLYIAKAYEEEFEKKGIRYRIMSEKDRGISDAFNKGIKLVTGDFVGLINADDEMLPDANLKLQEAYKRKVSEVYYGNCIWLDDVNNLKFISKPKEKNPDKLARLLYEMVIIHPSTYVKKSVYEKVGLFDLSYKYCMDQELLYRMVKKGILFCYVDEEFTIFKAGGVSDSNAKKVFKEASRIAIANKESKTKVKAVEFKKLVRNYLAKCAKKVGMYKLLKKNL